MVLDEGHDAARVGVEVVVAVHIVHAVHAAKPVVGLLVLGLVYAIEEGEVHDGLQMAVLLRQFAVFLQCGGEGRFCHPCFSYGVEVGIFVVDGLHPECHCVGVGIGVGVHTYAVDAYSFYPPLAVLNQIFQHVWVTLVEVGHGRHEPSVYCLVQIKLAGVGVEDCCQLAVCLEIFFVGLNDAILVVFCLVFEPLGGVEPVF